MNKKERLFYSLSVLLIILVYSLYLPMDIMDIDSTQYAEITREMVENQSYFQLRDNGRKYLDKPIMTFWILSVFFNIFGANNIAYRFPSILMAVISLVGIFKISMLLYKSERKAWLAILFYSLSPALFSMLTSPIIDIYLTTFIILVFMFYFYGVYKNPKYFYIMYIFIGIGFITKGPISLILPLISIGGNILITRNWELLKQLKIIHGIVIVLVPIFFWCYILYIDFNIYGPYFFLFLQSFGRFFSKIYDTGWNPFYFYYTFLFSILPIAIPFSIIVFLKIKTFVKFNPYFWKKPYDIMTKIFYKKDIVIYLWTFLVLFLLSFSKFRLPQYIFWLIPGACIVAGNWLEDYFNVSSKLVQTSYYFMTCVIFLLMVYLPFYTGEQYPILFYFILLIVVFFVYYFYRTIPKEVLFTLGSFLLLYTYIITSLYPLLIQFQPASAIAHVLHQHELSGNHNNKILYTYGIPFSHRSYAFYTKRITRSYILKKKQFLEELHQETSKFLVVEEHFLEPFKVEMKRYYGENIRIEELARFPYYKVSKPSIYFFHKTKRKTMLRYVYLLKLNLIKA